MSIAINHCLAHVAVWRGDTYGVLSKCVKASRLQERALSTFAYHHLHNNPFSEQYRAPSILLLLECAFTLFAHSSYVLVSLKHLRKFSIPCIMSPAGFASLQEIAFPLCSNFLLTLLLPKRNAFNRTGSRIATHYKGSSKVQAPTRAVLK